MKKKAQSPVNVCDRPSGHCEEFHEIRTRVSLVAMGAHPDAFGMRVVELSVVVADREETIVAVRLDPAPF